MMPRDGMTGKVETEVALENAAHGWHWLTRHPEDDGTSCLYLKAWSGRFEDERWWNLEEIGEDDTDWLAGDMVDEGWRYDRPATRDETPGDCRMADARP